VIPQTSKPVRPPSAEDRQRLTQISQIVDRLGPLERDTAPWLPKIKEAEDLRKQLRALYESSPAAEVYEALGQDYTALVGPKGKKTLIDYPQLWKRAGIAMMRKIATTTLDAIKEHCGPETLALVTSQELSGYRTIKIFARAEKKAA
jgi:hypothetical protein